MIVFNNKCSNSEKKERTDKLDLIAYEMFKNGESITKIAKKFGMNRCKLSKRLQDKYGITPCLDAGKKNINSNYFSQLNRENSYWIGLILADGNISSDLKKFELTLKDKEHICRFIECIKSNHILQCKKVNNNYYYRISFMDRNIVNDLHNIGILSNKSNIDFHLPQIPDNMFNDFLRGLIDGDGGYYVYNNRNCLKISIQISIGFNCKTFAYELLEKINSFYNANAKIYKAKTCYSIRICRKKDVFNILKLLFNDTDLYIQRKYQKIEKYMKGGVAK